MTVTVRNGLLLLAFLPPCLSFRALPTTSRRFLSGSSLERSAPLAHDVNVNELVSLACGLAVACLVLSC